MKCIAIALVVAFVSVLMPSEAIFKITNVECLVSEKNYANFTECRLKAVRRDVAAFTMRLHLLKTVVDCEVNVAVLRKYNTYKPFVLQGRFDICAFLKYRKLSMIDVVFKLLDDYTNLNNSCPLKGDIIIDRFVPKHSNLILPMPNGEYLFKSDWYSARKLVVSVNVWFTFKEMEPWEKV